MTQHTQQVSTHSCPALLDASEQIELPFESYRIVYSIRSSPNPRTGILETCVYKDCRNTLGDSIMTDSIPVSYCPFCGMCLV